MAEGVKRNNEAEMNRDEILGRFEALLDASIAAENPPEGIDAEILAIAENGSEAAAEAERQCDSYALWSAMTALTQEIRLQGRAFKELTDAMGSQASRIAEELQAVYRERERDIQRDAERRSRKEILGALIDLRDRLGRGFETAMASHAGKAAQSGNGGWFARMLHRMPADPAPDPIQALMKGYELGLERLDQMLDDFNVREIPCRGQAFDARRMNAIDLEESSAVPEGTVLEVYRSGYEWNGEIFRPAQVKVSRVTGANGK
jgi:molecular chaperone GrpE (heat shock protein)